MSRPYNHPSRYLTRNALRNFGAGVEQVANNAGRAAGAYVARQAVRYVQGIAYPEPTIDDAADNVQYRDVYPREKMSRSRWIGNFKKPAPYTENWETLCSKKGYVWCEEVFGKMSDANSLYVTHSTFDSQLYAQVITMTWLRKVLQLGGIHVKDRNYIIPFNSITAATGARFEYHEQNPATGAITTVGYETVAGETMTSLLANFSAMKDAIANYLNAGSNTLPYKLCFYSFDIAAGPASKFTLSGMLDCDCEVITIYSNSDIKMQNRTSPDEAVAGNQDVDRSDVQPLVGTLYNFKGDPKIKKIGSNNSDLLKLQGVLVSGPKLNRSADFPNVSYHNRPLASLFSNCKAKSNVVLQPGDVKRGHVFFKASGLIKSFLPKERIETSTGLLAYSVKCNSQLLVFEELMRTAGTNNITIQYERKLRIGCISKTIKPNVPFVPALTTGTKNLP